MRETAGVPAAARTLDIFELFAVAQVPLRLVDIAEATGTPVSTCQALLRTLQAQGYLWNVARDRTFYPTARLLALAEAVGRRDRLVAAARPLLERIRAATGETAVLGKRSGLDVIYLDVLESPQPIRYKARAGDRKPLHSSAVGKACMSLLAGKALDQLIGRLAMDAITPNTIVRRSVLKDEILQGRARGWFSTQGENVPDVMAISVGLVLEGEEVGLAVAGPIARLVRQHDLMVAAVTGLRRARDRAA